MRSNEMRLALLLSLTRLITAHRLGGYLAQRRGMFQMFYISNNIIIIIYQ